MRNRDSKERTKSWGRGLGIEGSQIIRNSFFFLNQCVSQSELVRRAIITQRKLGICCKFRWEFYPKTSFFSLVQFCMKVWLMIGLGMDIRYLTLKGETFPPNPSPLKWREKKILYPIIRAWADKLAPLFFFFSSPASLLFSARNKIADLSHNSQIFGSIMLQGTAGKKPRRR